MNRINFNIKDRKFLYGILCIVLVSVFTLTIAYAALNAVLTISGSAQVSSAEWDIHFDNIKVKSGSVSGEDPKITTPTTATFSTTLNMPGDYYEFTIDVVNDGSIDAMIGLSMNSGGLNAEQAKYIRTSITYENGTTIEGSQLLKKDSFARIKVRVEYRNDILASDLPTSTSTITFGLTLMYMQDAGNSVEVPDNGVYNNPVSANGSIEDIGTIVTIGTEQFYTIGTEGSNVKLLSMYNLNVGNKVTAYNLNTGDVTMATITNPTGLQSSDAIGAKLDSDGNLSFPWIGTVAFATEDKHGTNYYDYSGSLIETYVNDYEVAIEAMGVNVESARLITKDELVNTFGCNESENTCTGSAYPWIYATTYWSGAARDNISLWGVYSYGLFEGNNCGYDFVSGVRPVIIISKDYFN